MSSRRNFRADAERTAWPAGHVVHMTLDWSKKTPISVATCDCGWISRKEFSPAGSNRQDYAVEKHWRVVEGRRRKIAPPARRVHPVGRP